MRSLSTVRWQTILDHSRSQFRKPTNIGIHSLLTLFNCELEHTTRGHSTHKDSYSRPATNLAALSPMRLYEWWSCIIFIQIQSVFGYICICWKRTCWCIDVYNSYKIDHFDYSSYKFILITWSDFMSLIHPITKEDVLNQPLYSNINIKQKGKALLLRSFYKSIFKLF